MAKDTTLQIRLSEKDLDDIRRTSRARNISQSDLVLSGLKNLKTKTGPKHKKVRQANRTVKPGRMVPRAARYIRKIQSGKVSTSEAVRLAVQKTLDVEKDPEWTYYPAYVNRVLRFIETLPVTKGSGVQKRERLKLTDWEVFAISEIYGRRRTSNPNERKYREFLLEVGKKNGKTTLCASIALYELIEGEEGGEIFAAATTSKQARILFTAATHMAEKMVEYGEWDETIIRIRRDGLFSRQSSFVPVSKETKSLDGHNPSLALFDEAAAIKDRDAISVFETAVQSRESPLFLFLTTAQDDRDTAYYEKRDYVLRVLRGEVNDERVFGLIYGLDKGDDYKNPKVWIKANPNLHVSVIEETLMSKVNQAEVAVHQRAGIRLKNFNEWVDAEDTWIDADSWAACKVDITDEIRDKATGVYAGIDLSITTDLSALGVLYVVGRQYYFECECWTTEAYLESMSAVYRPVFKRAIAEKKLWLCEGRHIDLDDVEARIKELDGKRRFNEIGVDPRNAVQFCNKLEREGYPVIFVSQTAAKLNSVTKLTRLSVDLRRLHHDGSEFLSWQISNAKLKKMQGENTDHKVVRDKASSHRKIDGVIALLNAMACAQSRDHPENRAEMRRVRAHALP